MRFNVPSADIDFLGTFLAITLLHVSYSPSLFILGFSFCPSLSAPGEPYLLKDDVPDPGPAPSADNFAGMICFSILLYAVLEKFTVGFFGKR